MISILRYLSQAQAISERTRQLQYALFRTLAVQVCTPPIRIPHVTSPSDHRSRRVSARNCRQCDSYAPIRRRFQHVLVWNFSFFTVLCVNEMLFLALRARWNFSDFISVSCSCFPPVDAIATMVLMRDYRNTVWALATCRFSPLFHPFFSSFFSFQTLNESRTAVVSIQSFASIHHKCGKPAIETMLCIPIELLALTVNANADYSAKKYCTHVFPRIRYGKYTNCSIHGRFCEKTAIQKYLFIDAQELMMKLMKWSSV